MGNAIITRRGGGGELTQVAKFTCSGSSQTIQLDANKDYIVTATYGSKDVSSWGFGVWWVKKGVLTNIYLEKASFPDVYILPTLSADCVLTTGRGFTQTLSSTPTVTFIFGIS